MSGKRTQPYKMRRSINAAMATDQLDANKAAVRLTLCLDSLRPRNKTTGERRRPVCKIKPAAFDSFVQIVKPGYDNER